MQRGRPHGNSELKKARAEIKADREQQLKKSLSQIPRKAKSKKSSAFGTAHRRAWRAAELLNTLEKGKERLTSYQKTCLKNKIAQLRAWSRVNGPHDHSLDDCVFLEQFIKEHAPNWKWRDYIDRGELAWQNEQIAEENARLARRDKARTERFVTPDDPNLSGLATLRRLAPDDRTTWPTLRELKLATAIPERSIRAIVAGLSPKKDEIVALPFRRRFTGRGACPKRYGPRLVLAVLKEFLRRLPSYALGTAEREQARKAAVAVTRSLAAKLASSRSGT